jgi:hypothetical protein
MKMPAYLTKRRLIYLAILIFLVGFVSLYCSRAKAEDCPCPPEKPKPRPPAVIHNIKPKPKDEVRPLVGGGFSLGQGGSDGWHLFGGVQFPRDTRGGNWQLQIGGAFENHDAFDAECTIRCRTCGVHVNDWTDERAVISGVYVF